MLQAVIPEPRNARIASTFLGFEGHGIFTFSLTLEFGGASQGFGGYRLSGSFCGILPEILRVVGVGSWEDLKGKVIRIRENGMKVLMIGNVLDEDRWLVPEDYFNGIGGPDASSEKR